MVDVERIMEDTSSGRKTPGWSLRRLHSLDEAQIDELADVLIDCVEGGASVGFMLPLTRDRAVGFWRRVARGVAAGERALLVAEDAEGICGTVQLVLDQPENQPHRADLAKMQVRRRVRRQGLGPRCCAPLKTRRANAARRCSCSTPSPAATPPACTSVRAGCVSVRSPAMR